MMIYPNVTNGNIEELADILRFICRARAEDIRAFDSLPSSFMQGRKVGKIPTGSADVAATDRAGDFNYDTSYFYIFTGAAWRRASLGSW